MLDKSKKGWAVGANIVMVVLSFLALAPFVLLIIASFTDEAVAMSDRFTYDCGMNDIPMEVRGKFRTQATAWSRIIWDISTVGYVMSPNWTTSSLQPAPILNDDMTWSYDPSRHPIRLCCHVKRDSMFGDLFMKLENGDR